MFFVCLFVLFETPPPRWADYPYTKSDMAVNKFRQSTSLKAKAHVVYCYTCKGKKIKPSTFSQTNDRCFSQVGHQQLLFIGHITIDQTFMLLKCKEAGVQRSFIWN